MGDTRNCIKLPPETGFAYYSLTTIFLDVKQLYIVFFVWIISYQVFAQHSHRAYVTLADSLYRHHNYKDATYYYQRAIKNSNEPGNIMLKIARAFTEMNDVKEAEAW